MHGPSNTLLIEGSFVELSEELAQYLDALSKAEANAGIQADIAPLLNTIREKEQGEEHPDAEATQSQRDEVLKKIVGNAAILNTAPDKEFTAAYNLLITLANQSPIRDTLFARLCSYLEQPPPSSTQFGPPLAIATLTTIFNTLPSASESRYHVFLAILKVIRATSSAQTFEALIPQLETNIPSWIEAWELEEDDARSLYLAIADVATAASNESLSYAYLLKALETIPPSSAADIDSQNLAKRTLISALTNPSVTDFTPLTASDAIQALRRSDSALFDLLEIFSSDDYAAYIDSLETASLSSLNIPDSAAETLATKMRVLTLATIAASSSTRSVPYTAIASALQIPSEDVEMWVIDTIRAGLVEGKLSQLKQEFLVQRATYRVFGERQWAEIQGRLNVWRRSLESVLGVVRNERERFLKEGPGAGYEDAGERQQGGRMNTFGGGDNRRGGGRRQQQQREREPVEVD